VILVSNLVRRDIPVVIASILGTWIIAEYFFDIAILKDVGSQLKVWGVVIYSISFFLGLINVTLTHAKHVQRRTPGQWYFSAYTLVLMWGMFLIGIAITSKGYAYSWIFNNMYMPSRMTSYALTGFFIFSAGYRAFKAQTKEATIMLICGILVMLSNAPVGAAIWSGFGDIGKWLLDVGQLGVNRGVGISVAIGLLAFGLRVLLGYERGAFLGSGAEGDE
jgi:hypothetical protein